MPPCLSPAAMRGAVVLGAGGALAAPGRGLLVGVMSLPDLEEQPDLGCSMGREGWQKQQCPSLRLREVAHGWHM